MTITPAHRSLLRPVQRRWLSLQLLALVFSSSSLHNAASAQHSSTTKLVPPQALTPETFLNPPAAYRPIASLGDHGTSVDMLSRTQRALTDRDYGSILFSPNGDPARARKMKFDSEAIPTFLVGLLDKYPDGTSQWVPRSLPGEIGIGSYMKQDRTLPASYGLDLVYKPDPNIGYMSDAYFARMKEVLGFAHSHGRFATYYDEMGFPSGSADYSIPEKYFRKVLDKSEINVTGGQVYEATVSMDNLLALSAREKQTGQVIDLMPLLQAGALKWTVPAGSWSVMSFRLRVLKTNNSTLDYAGVADYFDPEATRWFIDHAYQPIADHLGSFLGNTINMTFFDDVGIFAYEKTWSDRIAARFKQLTGRDAGPYYPSLWQDIGPDTAAARIAFFGARASLLGEGFPKLVTEWVDGHGMQSTGHCPGNYDLQPVGMCGDPFKFYQYSNIPMIDVIFGHGFGRGGYKLISSVAGEQDKPIVAAENFGAGGDAMGYRRMIELYVRGFNRFVTSPAPFGKQVGSDTDFARWMGRTSLALQGGRHVADIAVLYPIHSLEAFYKFEAPENGKKMPTGDYISDDTDYQAVGEMLLDGLHRDFSFVHPDTLASSKYVVKKGSLNLSNSVNTETYKVLLMPGGKVLSVAALRKAETFYAAGGAILATSMLPSQSAEFGHDKEVQELIVKIFGIDPTQPMPASPSLATNRRGGRAMFVRRPSKESLEQALKAMDVPADVSFTGLPDQLAGNGVFSYLHKVIDGKDIYYFGNSSDSTLEATAQLRGSGSSLQIWDPATGSIQQLHDVRTLTGSPGKHTEFPLKLPPLAALIVVRAAE